MRQRPGTIIGIAVFVVCCGSPLGITANDTGGIIPWSPDNQRAAREIASELCARYDKYARITSVHAQPGDYIGFRCVWSPRTRP
jgi:hypothetical protein